MRLCSKPTVFIVSAVPICNRVSLHFTHAGMFQSSQLSLIRTHEIGRVGNVDVPFSVSQLGIPIQHSAKLYL